MRKSASLVLSVLGFLCSGFSAEAVQALEPDSDSGWAIHSGWLTFGA